jgi:glycosyltransferase involved in cell wall biosynthesis
MRILILSFYYPPDLSAGSFRTGALVEALAARLGPQDSLHIITTMPNRYASYKSDTPAYEEHGNIRIDRIELPKHKSGFRDQAFAFTRFTLEVLRRTRGLEADIVFATSSRLMTATLGAVVARRLSARLYLDIRDLFTDTLTDILKGLARLLVPIFVTLERWTLRQACAISIVSPGFEAHVREICPHLELSLRTNGIDREFLDFDYNRAGNMPPVILYAGNIGEGQGLERLIPAAALKLVGRYRFRIIGDGGRRQALQAALAAAEAEAGQSLDVELLPPIDRKALLEHYARADILLLHLNDYPAFRRVLPSKLFEYGATGKPILAGVDGVAADFIKAHLPNAAVFAPCDAEGLMGGLERLPLEMTESGEFIACFSRDGVMKELAEDIIALGQLRSCACPDNVGAMAGGQKVKKETPWIS